MSKLFEAVASSSKETEQTNKTLCYAENIHEAKHKSIMLLSLKNCKVKSVKYMGKLLY
jgi:hypothetical protein